MVSSSCSKADVHVCACLSLCCKAPIVGSQRQFWGKFRARKPPALRSESPLRIDSSTRLEPLRLGRRRFPLIPRPRRDQPQQEVKEPGDLWMQQAVEHLKVKESRYDGEQQNQRMKEPRRRRSAQVSNEPYQQEDKAARLNDEKR